jgi:hypothetical protein
VGQLGRTRCTGPPTRIAGSPSERCELEVALADRASADANAGAPVVLSTVKSNSPLASSTTLVRRAMTSACQAPGSATSLPFRTQPPSPLCLVSSRSSPRSGRDKRMRIRSTAVVLFDRLGAGSNRPMPK